MLKPLVLSTLLVISNSFSFSQCAWFTNNPTTMAAPTIPGNPLSYTPPGQNAGRRNLVVTNMIAGRTYRVSNCGSGFDTQLTIRDNGGTSVAFNNDNGPACAGTAASIDFVPTVTGTYWIQLNRFDCVATGNVDNGTVTVDWIPDYRAKIVSASYGASTWCAGDTRTISVTIQNTGAKTWTNSSPDINVVAKWNSNGANWADYYIGVDANGLAPGSQQTYFMTLSAMNATAAGPVYTTNLSAGSNNITFDLVKAGDCVFSSNTGNCGPDNNAFTTPTITITNPTPTNSLGTYPSMLVDHTDGTTQSYDFDFCTAVGKITDAAGGNVLGNTTMSATINSSILINPDAFVYVRRGFQVSPTSDGEMDLVMYFTQEDFNDYNSNATNFLSLPTSGDNSDPNIQFIRLATVIGGSYTISTPLGSGLWWNGSFWEFTVTVPTVAGAEFYAMTMPNCNGITVSNLAATNIQPDAVTATWTSTVTSPTWGWYGLQYREIGAPIWTSLGSVNDGLTSRFFNGLTPNTDYEVQIQRFCSSQSKGPWSSSVLFTTTNADCNNPMVFNTPTATSNAVTLTWPAVAGAGWYEVEYRVVGAGSWIGTGTTTGTSKLITGLTSSTNYEFRGRTFCPGGTPSAWSTLATATTNAGTGCSLPPVLSTGTITGTTAQITWPSVVGAAWYEFRYKQSASPTWISAGTLGSAATSKTLNGLTSSTQYDFQARTYCSNGIPSAWSSTTQFTTTGSLACETPPAIALQGVTNVSATIQWPSVPGAAWFEFRYKESSSGTWISAGTLGGASTTKVLNGLNPSTQYDFSAKSFCSSSSFSAWSGILQFTTAAAMVVIDNGTDAEVDQREEEIIENTETQSAGINNIELANFEVTVYPNPTEDKINILLTLEEADLIVYNAVGMIIYNKKVSNGDQISLRDVQSGVYFFEFITRENKIVKRIVKK